MECTATRWGVYLRESRMLSGFCGKQCVMCAMTHFLAQIVQVIGFEVPEDFMQFIVRGLVM